MVSERIQRRINQLLDEADEALGRRDWAQVRDSAQAVLSLDPENADARTYLAAAQRASNLAEEPRAELDRGTEGSEKPEVVGQAPPAAGQMPSSFANGRYSVKRFLGEGGKKRVYLAHDKTLARDVAFALIKTDGLDVEGRERITREAQAMGKLGTHPHVVSVFDMGSEGESPYLVTELMQGGDIEGLLEKAPDHRLAIPDAVSLAIQVCRGLEFAHSHGLVHRDLKPGNVWLTADGTPKIGDFGLAVSLDRSRLTRAGMMVGTVSYMPPEQAMGGEVSPRSDLYSLGAMLYEMVTGRPPFVGEESVAIITQHLNVPPVSPAWHRPECPPGLEALILRLLEKDAAKRPASAGEVRQALEALERAGASASPASQEPSSQAGTAGTQDNPLYRRTFVGREQELRQLCSAYDAAVSGRGSLVMVTGEPGIGKTSLCEQLATYAAVRGGRTLVGHCYEQGSLSLPYLPFVEAIRTYVLVRDPEGLKSELGTGANEVARIVSEVRDRIQVTPAEGGGAEEQRWRLLQAVAGFLRNAAQVQPLVLVLEDLHDADRGSLDLLLHLSRNFQGARLLVVGTYRDVEVDRTHPLSATLAELRRTDSFARIPLRGLTIDEVQRMMSTIRGQEVPWSRAEAVHRQTEGNPLFVQEVLRYLVEEGIVVRRGDRYVLTDTSAPDAGIPEGLRDVIGRRLSRVSEKTNQVLSVASVIGREFRMDLLQRVSGLTDEELDQALEEASERALIEERPAVGSIGFRFTHAFFRQTLYDELFASRRLRLHQQVARALEDVYARRLEEHAAELAEHFAHSTDPADLKKALTYSDLAARRALTVYAYSDAVQHLEQALKVQEVLDPDDRLGRCDLLLALGEALLPAGEPGRVSGEVAPKAAALAEAIGDRVRLARACELALTGISRFGGGSMATGTAWREWAARAMEAAPPGTVERARAELRLGGWTWAAGERGGGRSLIAGALAQARALQEPDLLFNTVRICMEFNTPGEQEERLALTREFAARARHGVTPRTESHFCRAAGESFLQAGERVRAEELWRQGEELAARTRDPFATLVAMKAKPIRYLLDGAIEEAAEAAAEIATHAEAQGFPIGYVLAAETSVRARLYLGQAEAALASLEPVYAYLGLDERIVTLGIAGILGSQRALCLAHQGKTAEAIRTVESLTTQPDVLQSEPSLRLVLAVTLLEIAILCGDASTAEVLSRRLAGAERTICVEWGITSVARHLGAAALLLGHPERARSHYELALEVCERIRFRPEIALVRLQLAEVLLDHYPDEQSLALTHLDFAIAECRTMKMQPALERALKHKGLLHA